MTDIDLTTDQAAEVARAFPDRSGQLVIGSVTRRPFVAGAPDRDRSGEWILRLGIVSEDVAEQLRQIIRGSHVARKRPERRAGK